MSAPQKIDKDIAVKAVEWYFSLKESPQDIELQRSWKAWIDSDQTHHQAWLKIEQFNEELGSLANPISKTLTHKSVTLENKNRRQLLRSILAVAFVGAGGGIALQRHQIFPVLAADYRTGKGETSQFTLTDGTRIELNAESAINVNFSINERSIYLLTGDVLIETAKDEATRPLVVYASWARFQPLGTRFYIRSREQDGLLAVYEGAVNLWQTDQLSFSPLRIESGQKLVFDQNGLSELMAADSNDLAWQQNILVVDAILLSDFVKELGYHHHGWIHCDNSVRHMRVSGSYPLDDIDRVLRALTTSLPIELVYRTRYWITLKAKSKN